MVILDIPEKSGWLLLRCQNPSEVCSVLNVTTRTGVRGVLRVLAPSVFTLNWFRAAGAS